jgi:hypothetical protein
MLIAANLAQEDLRLQHDPLLSPIVWDLGHIGHFEEVWLVENLESGDIGPPVYAMSLHMPTYPPAADYPTHRGQHYRH